MRSGLFVRIFAFIYLFTAVNREFLLFGVDLRYFNVCLGVVLVCWACVTRALCEAERKRLGVDEKLMLAFYACVALSNVGWLFGDTYFNEQLFWNLVVLNGYNLIAFLVFALWIKHLSERFVLRVLLIACFVLALSVFVVYAGGELPTVFISDSVRVSNSGESFKNLFGQNIRVAGFAEDANYATLSFLVGVVAAHLLWRNKRPWKYAYAGLMACGMALAFSRTIIVGSIGAYMIVLISRSPKSRILVSAVVMGVSLVAVVALAFVQPTGLMDTLQTRITLWGMAAQLFSDHPLLGGGLSSVRCFISMHYGLSWFVHCHSTWWQCLSECGLVATAVLGALFFRRMSGGTKSVRFLAIVFFFFSLTFEVVYLQWFVVALFLIPQVIGLRDEHVEKLDAGAADERET